MTRRTACPFKCSRSAVFVDLEDGAPPEPGAVAAGAIVAADIDLEGPEADTLFAPM